MIPSGWPIASSGGSTRRPAPGRNRATSRRGSGKRAGASRKRKPKTLPRAAHLEDWRRRWAVVACGLGLAGEASIEPAETALEVWDRAFSDADNHRNRVRRVAGIERNMSEFETEARALVFSAARRRCRTCRRRPPRAS